MSERREELHALEVHNRLLVAMQARLQMVAPHASTWPQALALRALPANLPNTLRDGASDLLEHEQEIAPCRPRSPSCAARGRLLFTNT